MLMEDVAWCGRTWVDKELTSSFYLALEVTPWFQTRVFIQPRDVLHSQGPQHPVFPGAQRPGSDEDWAPSGWHGL